VLQMQAQIIAFARDYQLVMVITMCAVPLALMIGSTRTALRAQAQAPDHAAVMD